MNKKWQLSLTITFLLLGILISAQLQTQNRLASFRKVWAQSLG